MSANWKKWLKWLGIAVLLYIIYRVISNRLSAPDSTIPVVTAGGGVTPVPVAFVYNRALVVRTRSFGLGTYNSQEVGYLQTWLNDNYSAGLTVDGDFGAKTAAKLLLHRPTANQVSSTLDSMGI